MNYIDDNTYTEADVSTTILKQFLHDYEKWERRQERRNLGFIPDYRALADTVYATYKEAKNYGY